ncbi:MAG: FHA domain-containing protein [Planctomycetes bacterium]|nr:FHA domain-containing protein [Planctomycetota bacterium]
MSDLLSLSFKNNSWLLYEGEHMLGRSLANAISIDEKGISRHHCRIQVTNEGCWIEDLNSSFGTLVNGKLIKRAALNPGDRIRLGDALLLLSRVSEGQAVSADGEAITSPDPAEAMPAAPSPATAAASAAPAATAAPSQTEEGVVLCPKCEMPNLAGEAQCVGCGAALPLEEK